MEEEGDPHGDENQPTPDQGVAEAVVVARNSEEVVVLDDSVVVQGAPENEAGVAHPEGEVLMVAPRAAMEVVVGTDGFVVLNESVSRKRKSRSKSKTKSPPKKAPEYADDNDDGLTCPICLDSWDMAGAHRLTSLKCGHLFGHSCIKRWLHQQTQTSRCCPSCKSRAAIRDMRFIYAKRVCAIDNSEEQRLREQLDAEKLKYDKLLTDWGNLREEVVFTKKSLDELRMKYDELMRRNNDPSGMQGLRSSEIEYKIYTEKNIEIAKEPSCRVMTYGRTIKSLAVSQKSILNLFPGFGVRFIDVRTFRPTNFLHVGTKQLRDICFNEYDELLATACMEKSVKLFSVRDRNCIGVFEPCDKPIWACAIEDSKDFLFLGSQVGSTYLYDKRNASNFLEEFKIEGDFSPVINICPVAASKAVPLGGFIVCKLQSLWFYEYTASQQILSSKLPIDGPFTSASYDASSDYILVTTRPTVKHRTARFIVAKLDKINDLVTITTVQTFNGSGTHNIISRSTQVRVEEDTVVAGFLQGVQVLSLWSIASGQSICSSSFSDNVFDTCGIHDDNNVYVAALTESKCRFMKIVQTVKR